MLSLEEKEVHIISPRERAAKNLQAKRKSPYLCKMEHRPFTLLRKNYDQYSEVGERKILLAFI